MMGSNMNPRAQAPGTVTGLPTISVIVNTCDRSDSLRTLLRSLDRQSYCDFEVVVALGPTRDDSLEMLASEFPNRVCVVRCPEFNLSTSRNLGLAHAAGEVVAFIDDDAVPCHRWMEQIAQVYTDPEVTGVGGRTHNVNSGRGEIQFLNGLVTALAEQCDVVVNKEDRPSFVAPDNLVFPRFHGTNMTYRRQALVEINGFDENFDYLFDDADLGVRLGLAGRNLVQLPGAVVYHSPTSGRNRGKHPYDLNWYCWIRSTVYFALKSGVPTMGFTKSMGHCLRMISNFFANVQDAADRKNMPAELHGKARRMLFKGSTVGILQGLLRKRRFPGTIAAVDRDLVRFITPDSSKRMPASPHQRFEEKEATSLQETPLRICLLSVGYPPTNTHGVARSTGTLARGLAELGHEVHVVTAGRKLHVTHVDGVYIHEVSGDDNPRYSDLAANGYRNLSHWLNHSHAVFDAVVSICRDDGIQLVDSPLWGLEGLVTAINGTVPVAVRVVTSMKQIADVHGQISAENTLLGELETRFLSAADLVVSNSDATTRTIAEVYRLEPDSLHIGKAPYGMVPAPDALVQPLSGAEVESPKVLFVGRLEKRKGILDLFEAIPGVLHRHPGARILIAGSDNSREDGFFDEHKLDYPTHFLRHFPESTASVDFLGFVDEDQLEELYRTCDLFVAPSLYESFGLIYLEAMNWARPVIACSAGGPEEIVVNGRTGVLVPPGDAQALETSINNLLGSPSKRRDMGIAGRRRLLENYTHLSMARSFESLYRETLDRAGRERP